MKNFLTDRSDWVKQFVPRPFRGKGWSDFPADTDPRRAVLERATQYAQDLLEGYRRPVVLYGPSGTGKTFLASLIWQEVAAHIDDRIKLKAAKAAATADNLVWINGADMPAIAGKIPPDQNGVVVSPHHLSSAYFCVVDDVDKCPKQWGGPLYGLFDERLWMKGLPTIFTMNVTPASFVKKYGEHGTPMFSRLKRSGALVMRLDK